MSNKKKYIVIGSSAAGLSAVLQLRRLDAESSIVCISDEQEQPYNKCLLASYCANNRTLETVFTQTTQAVNTNFMLGTRVVQIHAAEREIVLDTGQALAYDGLFLGLGCKPIIPQVFQDTNRAGIFTYYSLNAVQQILAYIQQHDVSSVIVIGAGLNGLECADAFMQRGLKVTVIEREAHILPMSYDSVGAEFITNRFENNGCSIYTQETVVELITHDNKISGVVVSSGTMVPGQLIIIAAGMQPATDILENTGIELVNGAVVANSFLQTTVPEIYAGGDCLMRNGRWPDAVIQGMHAAHNMAGEAKTYPGVMRYAKTTVRDVPIVMAGDLMMREGCHATVNQTNETYERLVFDREDRLRGFFLINSQDRLASLRKTLCY